MKPQQPFFIRFANGEIPYTKENFPEMSAEYKAVTFRYPAILGNVYSIDITSVFTMTLMILEGIINNGGELIESQPLYFFIRLKKACKLTHIVSDGRLIEIADTDDPFAGSKHVHWLRTLCYSLIDFLCNGNLKKLKKCPICGLFFIAKNVKRIYCYKIICMNKYHKNDMRNRRKRDPVRYC